jgi:hypothetical protein
VSVSVSVSVSVCAFVCVVCVRAREAGLSKWFFKNEGVDAHYTIAEELSR